MEDSNLQEGKLIVNKNYEIIIKYLFRGVKGGHGWKI